MTVTSSRRVPSAPAHWLGRDSALFHEVLSRALELRRRCLSGSAPGSLMQFADRLLEKALELREIAPSDRRNRTYQLAVSMATRAHGAYLAFLEPDRRACPRLGEVFSKFEKSS